MKIALTWSLAGSALTAACLVLIASPRSPGNWLRDFSHQDTYSITILGKRLTVSLHLESAPREPVSGVNEMPAGDVDDMFTLSTRARWHNASVDALNGGSVAAWLSNRWAVVPPAERFGEGRLRFSCTAVR